MRRLPPRFRWFFCFPRWRFLRLCRGTCVMRHKPALLPAHIILTAVVLVMLGSCKGAKPKAVTPAEFTAARWEDLTQRARGSEVAFGMWAGDEERNRFFRSTVSKHLKDDLGISLRIVPLGDTAEAINKLLNEKGAGKSSGGSIDVVW